MASSSVTTNPPAEWDVSSIMSRLIIKAALHRFLNIESSMKLSQLALMMRRVEAGMNRLDYLLQPAFFFCKVGCPDELIPLTNRLLQQQKRDFLEAERVLDLCIERQMMRESLTNHSGNWVKKKLMSSVLKYSSKAYMSRKQLKKNIESIERTIHDAYGDLAFLTHVESKIETICAKSQPISTLKVIGRDADCEKIVVMLRQPDQHDGQPTTTSQSSPCYSVIGIHGVGGSGKTTLADLVYAHERNAGHFDVLMRIRLSPDRSAHDTIRAMLERVTGEPCPEFRSPHLMREDLEEELSAKRFLLVLDDVRYDAGDAVGFEELRHVLFPLRVAEAGSRILATSRSCDALFALGGAVKPRCISIPELDDDAFFELFMHYALQYSSMDEIDRRNFEIIGADIAKKLRKSPRVATVVAQFLRVRLDVHYWLRVCDKQLVWD